MHAYLLALEIEPIEVNKVYVALPLHCTVVPWFRSEKPPSTILEAVTAIAHEQKPIELISGPADRFGREQDVPVNRISNEDELRAFHIALYDALQVAGIEPVEPEWMGDGYTPHVTRQSSGRFDEGRKFLSTKLYLVEALVPEELQQKKIISKIFLGKKS